MNELHVITVIVPVYNVQEYLERCVNSILNQTYSNIQVILVDDGSTDDSGVICEQLASKDRRVFVVHQDNAGQSVARNNALKFAKGDYLCYIDSDDFWDEDMLEYLLGIIIKEGSDIGVCAVRHIGFPGVNDKEISDEVVTTYTGQEGAKYTILGLKGFSGSACHAIFKVDSVAQNEFFLEGHIYEDLEYMTRLMLKSRLVTVSNLRKYNYCYRPNNSSSTPTAKRKQDLDAAIEHIRTTVSDYGLDLGEYIDQRYISNGLYLLRSLHKNENELFSEISKDVLKYTPNKKMLTKSDWVFANALKFGEIPFKLTVQLYKLYKSIS